MAFDGGGGGGGIAIKLSIMRLNVRLMTTLVVVLQQPGGIAKHCTNMKNCFNFCMRIEDTHQRSVCCKHLSWNLFIGTFLALMILVFMHSLEALVQPLKFDILKKIIKMKETKLKVTRQKCLQNNCFPMLSLLQFAFL